MNERIRAIRKSLGLSQTVFGARIGVTIGVIKNLEQGLTTLKSPLFELLCSTYHVNPTWLTTGEGEMFASTDNSSLNALQNEYDLSPAAILIVQRFIEMNATEREAFLKTAKTIIEA